MSSTNYLPKGIIETVDELNRTIFLPDLQRPYEWTEEQIYKLFDSILRGYPINTFLFWRVKKDDVAKYSRYRFVDTKPATSEKETKPFSGNDCYLVLDGQQRLTAFNIALNGYMTQRKKLTRLYFNVLSGLNKDDDDALFKFEFLPETLGNLHPDKRGLWVRVSWLVEELKSKKLASMVVGNLVQTSDPNYHAVFQNLERLNEFVVHGHVYYYEESEQDEDKVLDIFIRTNAGGTRLGYSDLLFSKIKVRWRGVMDARNEFREVLESMNEGGLKFDNDFILKTALVCLAKDSEAVRFKLSKFNDEKVLEIQTVWDKLKNALIAVRDHMVNELYISNDKLITSYNALIPLVSYAFLNDLRTFERKGATDLRPYYDDIKDYVYRTLVTGAFGSQADTTLWNIQEIMRSEVGKPFPAHKIFGKLRSMGKQIEIQEEVVQGVQYGTKRSYPLLNIVYNRLGLRFKSHANQIQQDHIFSKNELAEKYAPEDINDVANIRFVSFAENNWKSDTPYAEWVKTLGGEDKNWHMIPAGIWTVENYTQFLQARRKLLIERAQKALEHFSNN